MSARATLGWSAAVLAAGAAVDGLLGLGGRPLLGAGAFGAVMLWLRWLSAGR